MLQPGDLIRDTSDGELGLVLSHPRSCGPDYTRESYGYTRGEEYKEFVLVNWPSYDEPSRVVLEAVRKGWIEIISGDR